MYLPKETADDVSMRLGSEGNSNLSEINSDNQGAAQNGAGDFQEAQGELDHNQLPPKRQNRQ